MLRSRFGLSEGTNLDDAQALLRGQVSKVLDDRKVGDVCFFLGQILDVPFPDSPLTKALRDDPAEGRMLRRAVIKSFFEADAARSPICLVLDDLDTAGEDSIALVSYLAEHVRGPLLLVCSMRPEMAVAHPGWPKLGGERHVRIDMGAVDAEIARRVMRALLAPTEGGVPELLVDAGVRLAGGNLGLLRALIQIFRDSGVLVATAGPSGELRYQAHLDRLEDVELPVNVDETVAMRVAALAPPERQLLERAAAMGKVFWAGALVVLERAERKPPAFWELAETSEVDTIDGLLASLEDRGYVARTPSSSFPGETQLTFCHQRERQHLGALTPPDRRAAHHLAIAEWLRLRQPEPPTREHLVLLAYHLDLGGAAVRAGLTYLDAADSARESYAARDAVAQYERGLELLGEAEALRRVDAIHHLGEVLHTVGRTDDALRAYRDMLALAYRLDLPEKGGTAHDRLGRLYRATGALPEAQRHLETALALFESVADARGVAACHDDVGLLLWTKGDYEDALRRLRTALELRKGLGERRAIAQSLHNVGMVLRDFGRPQKAQEALDAALVIRREEGDLIGVAQTLDGLGQLAGDQREL
ncbi:MAG: tetratricopeptide repeat protein, partial [Deltaproteobacteria bacterium]|nr:tetratricopeptide repeat protein [Deltaproteobacteria bacterium]